MDQLWHLNFLHTIWLDEKDRRHHPWCDRSALGCPFRNKNGWYIHHAWHNCSFVFMPDSCKPPLFSAISVHFHDCKFSTCRSMPNAYSSFLSMVVTSFIAASFSRCHTPCLTAKLEHPWLHFFREGRAPQYVECIIYSHIVVIIPNTIPIITQQLSQTFIVRLKYVVKQFVRFIRYTHMCIFRLVMIPVNKNRISSSWHALFQSKKLHSPLICTQRTYPGNNILQLQ